MLDLIDDSWGPSESTFSCLPQSIAPFHSTRPHDHAPRPLTMAAAINSRVAFGDKVAFKHNEALTTGTGEATRRVGASAGWGHTARPADLSGHAMREAGAAGRGFHLASVISVPACRGPGSKESRAARATSRRTRRLQPMLPAIRCSAAQRRS